LSRGALLHDQPTSEPEITGDVKLQDLTLTFKDQSQVTMGNEPYWLIELRDEVIKYIFIGSFLVFIGVAITAAWPKIRTWNFRALLYPRNLAIIICFLSIALLLWILFKPDILRMLKIVFSKLPLE